MDTVARGQDSPVGSVDKALRLIELLADAGPQGAALRDLVAASGLNKASVHRLLQALLHRGFAEQDAHQRYRLGNRPALLVEQYLSEENLPALFRPTLLGISHRVQELVHLGTLESTNVLYLDKVEPDRTIRVMGTGTVETVLHLPNETLGVILAGCTDGKNCGHIILIGSFSDLLDLPADWVAKQNADYDLIKVWTRADKRLAYSASGVIEGLPRSSFRAWIDRIVDATDDLATEAIKAGYGEKKK